MQLKFFSTIFLCYKLNIIGSKQNNKSREKSNNGGNINLVWGLTKQFRSLTNFPIFKTHTGGRKVLNKYAHIEEKNLEQINRAFGT